jgi:hypothetical protein
MIDRDSSCSVFLVFLSCALPLEKVCYLGIVLLLQRGWYFWLYLELAFCARVYMLVHDWTCFVNEICLRMVVGFFPPFGVSQEKSPTFFYLLFTVLLLST